jgi:hypothetical protein
MLGTATSAIGFVMNMFFDILKTVVSYTAILTLVALSLLVTVILILNQVIQLF